MARLSAERLRTIVQRPCSTAVLSRWPDCLGSPARVIYGIMLMKFEGIVHEEFALSCGEGLSHSAKVGVEQG
jgi:hypothetical protein